MTKDNKKLIVNTQKLVITAMFAALTTVATIVIQIPLMFGFVNLGDMFVLLSAFMLGSWYGVAAASIGSALGDIILGYAIYAPATFIIKGLMSFVVCVIVKALSGKIKISVITQVIAGIVAELVMVAGYFFYEAVILGYSWAAASSIVGNLAQGGIGIALAVSLLNVFNSRKIFVQNQTNEDSDLNDK